MGILFQITAKNIDMAFKAILSFGLLATALGAPAAQGYAPAPAAYAPAPVAYPDLPPVYKYGYAVKDDYSFVNFNANEQRDGYNAEGGYRVALPDGRTQVVTYTATADGYIAEVRYEGEAQYPEYKPSYPAAPAYAPAPVYAAAPVYAPRPGPTYTIAAAPAVEAKAAEEVPAVTVVEEAAPVAVAEAVELREDAPEEPVEA